MKRLTSNDLQVIQDELTRAIKRLLREYDYGLAKTIIEVTEKIDEIRRETWNEEKFGAYEKFVDEFVETVSENEEKTEAYGLDDIPF